MTSAGSHRAAWLAIHTMNANGPISHRPNIGLIWSASGSVVGAEVTARYSRVKYGVGGGVLVILGFVVGQALGFATAPASILMDAIQPVVWGVILSGTISSTSLGQGLAARPLWIGLSLVLAFALGAAGGLPW